MQSQNLKEHESIGQKILAMYVPSVIQFPLCVQYFHFLYMEHPLPQCRFNMLSVENPSAMQIQYAKRRKSLSNADPICLAHKIPQPFSNLSNRREKKRKE